MSTAPAPFARILLGYVATEQGADARALGAELAAACGSQILLVSVVAAVWIENIGQQTGPAVVHSGQRERAASALEEAAAALSEVGGVGHVERRLEASSSPARGLHDTALSEHADLIIVGSSRRGPLGRVLLGAVGERLLSGAPCAVAVAPKGYALRQARQLTTIAVAFDGSPESLIALRKAHDLAPRTGANLCALMVIKPPAAIPGQFVPLPGLGPRITLERAETLLRQERAARAALDAGLEDLDGERIEQRVLFGTDPASAILDAADDVDLLVLGSRAYGPLRRALLGSVSHTVIRHARCPVLVMPRVSEQSADRVQGRSWASGESS